MREGGRDNPLAPNAFPYWPGICGRVFGRFSPSRKFSVSRTSYDEMQTPEGGIRPHYEAFAGWLARTSPARIAQKREEAERAFHRVGITFAVYGEDSGTERLIPFDIVPRIIPADQWKLLDRGLRQRVRALNAFLHDVYHEQAILAAGVVPRERVLGNAQYRREMQGMDVPGGIYAHIAGVDIVRAGEGEYYVLEDNLRVPSGVSYMPRLGLAARADPAPPGTCRALRVGLPGTARRGRETACRPCRHRPRFHRSA